MNVIHVDKLLFLSFQAKCFKALWTLFQ